MTRETVNKALALLNGRGFSFQAHRWTDDQAAEGGMLYAADSWTGTRMLNIYSGAQPRREGLAGFGRKGVALIADLPQGRVSLYAYERSEGLSEHELTAPPAALHEPLVVDMRIAQSAQQLATAVEQACMHLLQVDATSGLESLT